MELFARTANVSRVYINTPSAMVTTRPRFNAVYRIILRVIVINQRYDDMVFFNFCSYRACLNPNDSFARCILIEWFTRVSLGTRSSFSHCEYAISESTKDATPTLPSLATSPGSPNELWGSRGGGVLPLIYPKTTSPSGTKLKNKYIK